MCYIGGDGRKGINCVFFVVWKKRLTIFSSNVPRLGLSGIVACCAFSFVRKPTSVCHLFGSWMNGFSDKNRGLVQVGVAAVLWSIWKTRNNACFRSIFPENPTTITN
jgi:hypothetical protein